MNASPANRSCSDGISRLVHARQLSFRLWLLTALSSLAMTMPATAQSLGEALKSFIHDDATATFHLRRFYMDRTNVAPPNYVAWAPAPAARRF